MLPSMTATMTSKKATDERPFTLGKDQTVVTAARFRREVTKLGLTKMAQKFRCRHSVIREVAEALGLEIRRGRPQDKGLVSRDKKIMKARAKGETIADLAEEFGLSIGRVQQICSRLSG